MIELLFQESERWAQMLGIAVLNSAIPSAVVIVLAYAAMRLRGWNASSRYCAWWLTLAFTVLLPLAMLIRRPAEAAAAHRPAIAVHRLTLQRVSYTMNI